MSFSMKYWGTLIPAVKNKIIEGIYIRQAAEVGNETETDVKIAQYCCGKVRYGLNGAARNRQCFKKFQARDIGQIMNTCSVQIKRAKPWKVFRLQDAEIMHIRIRKQIGRAHV